MLGRHTGQGWARHVKENLGIYFFIVLLFLSGIVLGALAVPTLAIEQQAELMDYLHFFIGDISSDGFQTGKGWLWPTIFTNAKTILLMWLGGLMVIGLPISLALMFIKGFSTGFTVAFLVSEIRWRGLILAAAAIFPHSLLSIPATLFLAVGATKFSISIIKQRFSGTRSYNGSSIQLLNYGLFVLYGEIAMGLASAVESYVTPILVRTAVAWLL